MVSGHDTPTRQEHTQVNSHADVEHQQGNENSSNTANPNADQEPSQAQATASNLALPETSESGPTPLLENVAPPSPSRKHGETVEYEQPLEEMYDNAAVEDGLYRKNIELTRINRPISVSNEEVKVAEKRPLQPLKEEKVANIGTKALLDADTKEAQLKLKNPATFREIAEQIAQRSFVHLITIKVKEAENLPIRRSMGKVEPYVKFTARPDPSDPNFLISAQSKASIGPNATWKDVITLATDAFEGRWL